MAEDIKTLDDLKEVVGEAEAAPAEAAPEVLDVKSMNKKNTRS